MGTKLDEKSLVKSWEIGEELTIWPNFSEKCDKKVYFDDIDEAQKVIDYLMTFSKNKDDRKKIFSDYKSGKIKIKKGTKNENSTNT